MRATRTILVAGAAMALAQTSVAQARVRYICTEYNAAEKMLSIEANSGCTSSSLRYVDNDLALNVDQSQASINVTGDIKFGGGGQIHTADCMARKTVSLSAEAVERRRYSLSYGDQYIGQLDLLSGSTVRKCHSVTRGRPVFQFSMNKGIFAEWNEASNFDYAEWRGASLAELVGPLMAGFSAEEEGRPTMELRISQQMWRPSYTSNNSRSDNQFVAIEIERGGFADDSVSGDRFFGEAVLAGGAWRLRNLWRQNMCARGTHAGQWTMELCP
ncbi:hypothetical protein [Altererythrobacter sp. ZODW24]|uniref:hypothetical protein n=1 Tax=Altererythrobacter sp. ZODW24 TaxID=2185142 RepID=UPI0013B3A6B0|nr:hypothetical protein [Altererythrobacter sp. ZODW24]